MDMAWMGRSGSEDIDMDIDMDMVGLGARTSIDMDMVWPVRTLFRFLN